MPVFTFNQKSFYQEFDVLHSTDKNEVIQQIENEMREYPNPQTPRRQTYADFHKRLQITELHTKVIDIMHQCGYSDVKIHRMWALCPEPNSLNMLHTHKLPSVVFYLQNPSPNYGTKIRDSGTEIIVCTPENSLLVFDKNIEHAPIYPPDVVNDVYPRYSIIYEFLLNK